MQLNQITHALKLSSLGLFLVGIIYSSGFAIPLKAEAQNTESIRISPLLFERRVDPGDVLEEAISITNLSSETKTYYLNVRNIKELSERGSPIVAAEGEKTGWEMSSWVELSQTTVEVAPNQTKRVPFTIRVPNPAAPGAHLGLMFVSLSAEAPEETGLGIGYDVGSILNLRVNGAVVEEALIREFRTSQPIYGSANVNFIARVDNRGNTVLRPRGPIEITNIFGKKVATLVMNDSAGAVLPKGTRSFETSWAGEGLAFGRYEAVMGLVYGEDEKSTVAASTTFWILPGKVIGIVAAAFIVVLLAVLIAIKLIVRRKLRQLGIASGAKRKAPGYVGTVQDMSLRRLVMVSAGAVVLVLVLLAILFFMFA